MVIFSTVTEKSQMACHEWEENSKGTILTPSKYTASDTFKIIDITEVYYTMFGIKVWRKSYETNFDDLEWTTMEEYKQ
jgi:hypothetical protein